jgi:dipeptidyl aminopeptidase/acylaminoacyl peptidase
MRFWLCLTAALSAATVACAAPPLEAYSRLSEIEGVDLSPSGDRFMLIGRIGDQRRISVRRTDGELEYLANLGPTRLSSVSWAGEDHLVIMLRSTVGGALTNLPLQEWSAAVLVDLKTKKTTSVFKATNTMVDAVFAWFGNRRIDGTWYAFVGGVSIEKVRSRLSDKTVNIYPDLYRVNLDTGAFLAVARANLGRAEWVLDASGAVVGHSTYDAANRIQTIYAGARDDRPLLSRGLGDGKLVLDGQGRSADSLLMGDRTTGEEMAREVRTGATPGNEVLFTGVDGEQSVHDPNSGLLIGITKHDGLGVEFIDPALQRRFAAAVKAFPDVRTHLVSFTSGLDRMVVYTEGAKDSGTYWLIDIAKKSATPIGDARPEIKPSDLGPVRVFNYKAGDGLALDGVLTSPPNGGLNPLPLVVIAPNAPHAQRQLAVLDLQAQALASRGYAVFRPNTRGFVGYGEAFRKAADGEVGRMAQSDISDGVAALAAQGVIDPKRVCIVGSGGYGGYVALAGVTLQHGLYRCSISDGGLTDLPQFANWARDQAPQDPVRQNELKAPMGRTDGEDLAAISPAKLAARADVPVLMIHDADDTRVPIAQARTMEHALKSAGRPVELVVLPGLSHAPSPEARQQTVYAAIAAFLEKHNPPS